MEFTYPADVCFECNCCGICCADTDHKLRHILLLESEAEEISIATGKPIEDFCNESNGTQPYIYEMKNLKATAYFSKTTNAPTMSTVP